MVFPYAYDVQRSPAYPAKGVNIHMWGLDKPYLADGRQETTSEGNWTLTPIGTYALVKNGEKDSRNLKNLVMGVASQYPGLDADTIVLHELKDGDVHIAYGITVAYNKADSMAVFLGDNLAGSAGFLLSVDSKTGDVYTDATTILTDWVAPPVYDITVDNSANGTTGVSAQKAVAEDTITITVTPNQGYHVASVTYNDGKNITADTTITAVYEANEVTNNQTPSNGGETTKTPQTGDTNQIFMWFALAAGSCVVYKFVLEIERNKKRIRRR